MNIITITLNPAVDLHLSSEALIPGSHNTAKLIRRDSAGKGINVSRALLANGITSHAVVFLGKERYDDYLLPLTSLGMKVLPILVDGKVRENVNIQVGDKETVIATDGPSVNAEEVRLAEDAILPLIGIDTYAVLSGSIPKGSDKDAILSMLYEIKSRGAKLIIDSRSLSIEEIIALHPHVIKPNGEEAEALTGITVKSVDDGVRAAEAVREMGCENVMLTLGASGAVLASKEGVYVAKAPSVEVLSSVGAGDSTIAGYLASMALGETVSDNLRRAIAFGSAACMAEGSLPPSPSNVASLLSKIQVRQVN